MPADAGADPLSVPCPRCTAGIGEDCFVVSSGRELPQPHVDRRRRAAEVAEKARLQAEGDAEHRIDGKRWRRVYAAARLELEQRAAWTPLAAEQLEALVLNMEAAEVARRRAKGKPLVAGSQGQDVANPAITAALRYDAQALAIATALKLTPATRGSSAPPDEEQTPEDDDAGERDGLSELDELARRRKAGGRRKRG